MHIHMMAFYPNDTLALLVEDPTPLDAFEDEKSEATMLDVIEVIGDLKVYFSCFLKGP